MRGFLKPSPEWDRITLFIPGSTGESQAGWTGGAERQVLIMRQIPEEAHGVAKTHAQFFLPGSQNMVPDSLRTKLLL